MLPLPVSGLSSGFASCGRLCLVFILSFLATFPDRICAAPGPALVVVITTAPVDPDRRRRLGSPARSWARGYWHVHAAAGTGRATPEPIELAPNLVLDLGELYRPIRESLTGIFTSIRRSFSGFRRLFPFASGAAVVIRASRRVRHLLVLILASTSATAEDCQVCRHAPDRHVRSCDGWASWHPWDAFARGHYRVAMAPRIAVNSAYATDRRSVLAMIGEFIPGIGLFISASRHPYRLHLRSFGCRSAPGCVIVFLVYLLLVIPESTSPAAIAAGSIFIPLSSSAPIGAPWAFWGSCPPL
jgi:hypothetical protein